MLRALTSPRGMVTAPHHLAAQAGAGVLRDGGNAVEAMVAAAATIAVVYPHMNSIGGDGFWLISRPGQTPQGIEACGRAAGLATPQWYRRSGHSAIPTRGPLAANTVAGAVSGWQAALAHAGSKLPLARLLEDAIRYAREGTPVTQSQANYTAKFRAELEPQPGFAQTFLHDGQLPAAHTMQRFAALAATLEQLAHAGLDDFYRGDVAREVAADLDRVGSPVTRADLERTRATLAEPLSVAIEAGTLYNTPPPTQGLASLMMLALFDRLGVKEAESFEHVHGLIEAAKRALRVRDRTITDPDRMPQPADRFLADVFLDEEAAAIDRRKAGPLSVSQGQGDTIWMGAADASGLVVSYIQSLYWEFGSGVVLPRTGVLMQNRGTSFSLDRDALNALEPGLLPLHTLNPALAVLRDGRIMAYGTMGGDAQPQIQAALFTRHVLFRQPLEQALDRPRWFVGRTWGSAHGSVILEGRFDGNLIDRLMSAGHDVDVMPEPYAGTMGHAGAVVLHPNGTLEGAHDPRADGGATGI